MNYEWLIITRFNKLFISYMTHFDVFIIICTSCCTSVLYLLTVSCFILICWHSSRKGWQLGLYGLFRGSFGVCQLGAQHILPVWPVCIVQRHASVMEEKRECDALFCIQYHNMFLLLHILLKIESFIVKKGHLSLCIMIWVFILIHGG